MAAMNLPPAPLTCCTPPQAHWPLPVPLVGALLTSCSFEPDRLAPGDFALAGIAAPESIQRSVAKRQTEYLAGRLCARAALAHAGLPVHTPGMGADRAPLWPQPAVGSITHGDRWAAAIVADAGQWQGLGLDVESLLAPRRALRLAEEILTPAEVARLPKDEAQAALAITLTFSIKESLFKALYPLVLTRFYFHDAELLDWSESGDARLRLLIDLPNGWVRDRELQGQFTLMNERLLSLVAVRALR